MWRFIFSYAYEQWFMIRDQTDKSIFEKISNFSLYGREFQFENIRCFCYEKQEVLLAYFPTNGFNFTTI